MSIDFSRTGYTFDTGNAVWRRPDFCSIAYSDGDETESRIESVIANAQDIRVLSDELALHMTDWPSRYHLSGTRANILRPFVDELKGDILEVGAGCGAITRFLGESGANVVAVEGSLRRARIARSRTRDLDNVSVVAERFDSFDCAQKFDIVTLIGVLEYANMFTRGTNPALEMLRRARTFLKETGKLIVAIENKLGLKYFAGAPEDHVGLPFYGIEDRYLPDGVQTFGRHQLENLLRDAGYGKAAFFAPFPDYKLPTSIVSESGFKSRSFDGGAFAWQTVKADHQFPKTTAFSLERAWPSVISNGLGLDLANSFLVVAPQNEEGISGDTAALAYHYSTNRLSQYCKETTFLEVGDGSISVRVNPLIESAEKESADVTGRHGLRWHSIGDSKYVRGQSLALEWIHAFTDEHPSTIAQANLLSEYLRVLARVSEVPLDSILEDPFNPVLPGRMFDAIPSNFLRDDAGNIHVIDLEWLWPTGVSPANLLFRALMSTFSMVSGLGRIGVQHDRPEDLLDAIRAAMKLADIELSDSRIVEYLQIEGELYEQTSPGTFPVDMSALYMRMKSVVPAHLPSSVFREAPYQLELRDQAIASLHDQLDHQVKFTQALLSSSSWKLTMPLRFVRRLASRDPRSWRMFLRLLPSPVSNLLRSVRCSVMRLRASALSSPSNVAALNELAGEGRVLSRFAPSPMKAVLPANALPNVDISIVTYNSEKWVDGFIASVSSLDYPRERLHLYFVDNSSQDQTMEALKRGVRTLASMGIEAHVLARPNLGFGAGHNAGIGAGKSSLCLVTNIDLVFEPVSLARAVSHAVADEPHAAAWEFRQKPYEHPKNYDPISGATNWNSHACVLLRRSAFDAVGGYCNDLFMYGEDVELSYRLRAAGFRLRFSPHAVVYHYTYETAGELKPLQLTGSTFANLYIRLSYGTLRDMLAVPGMALSLLLSKERFAGARREHLKSIGKLLRLAPGLIRKNRARNTTAAFPFNGWDYDLIRKGAFHKLEALPENCPKVTVITRTYKGRENLLLQAMTSVANQTYPNIEHIVTEDRGEFLKDVVSRFAAETDRDIVYVSGNKLGRSDAGNLALAAASGRWCVFLDDDDLFYCDHVEVLVDTILKRPDARAAFALAFEVPTRKLADDWSAYSVSTPISHEIMALELNYDTLTHRNLFPIQSVLFERDLFVERGGFDEDLEALEDWALWQRYAYHVRFVLVPKTTSLYRTPQDVDHFNDRSQVLTAAYDALVSRMAEWRTAWDRQLRGHKPAQR